MKKILYTLPILTTLALTSVLHFLFEAIDYPILELLLICLVILLLVKQIIADIFIENIRCIKMGEEHANMLQIYDCLKSKISTATYTNVACIVLICLEERLSAVFMVLFDIEHLRVDELFKMMGLIGAYFTILRAFDLKIFTYKLNFIKKQHNQSINL